MWKGETLEHSGVCASIGNMSVDHGQAKTGFKILFIWGKLAPQENIPLKLPQSLLVPWTHSGSHCFMPQAASNHTEVSKEIFTETSEGKSGLMAPSILLEKDIRGDTLHEATCYESLISQFSLSAAIKLQWDKTLTKENECNNNAVKVLQLQALLELPSTHSTLISQRSLLLYIRKNFFFLSGLNEQADSLSLWEPG